jgi:S-adenosyl-L-methionine hydrolase (adenosine-forming)
LNRPPIVLLTDFGQQDGYPGVMKGVIYSFCPEAPIIDLTHGVPAQDLGSAAFLLWKNVQYFPRDSIFVVVVDPGVGSPRKILYLQWNDWQFLAPDNGVLTPFFESQKGIKQVRQVTQSDLFLVKRGRTFDGRDRFAPIAAHLARGFEPSELGPELAEPVRLEGLSPRVRRGGLKLIGRVVYVDSFGNLITTIEEKDLEELLAGHPGTVRIAGQTIPIVESYSAVEPGHALAVVGGFGTLEVAINQGNAQRTLRVASGQTVEVRIKA